MIRPSAVERTYFVEQIAKHCGGDKAKAEKVPMEAFVKAVQLIGTREDAERFLAGHLHWLQGKYPRTLEAAMSAAKANVGWVFEDGLPPDQQLIWNSLWEEPIVSTAKSPEEAFKVSQAVGEKLIAGKDPGKMAALARKALLKKAAAK